MIQSDKGTPINVCPIRSCGSLLPFDVQPQSDKLRRVNSTAILVTYHSIFDSPSVGVNVYSRRLVFVRIFFSARHEIMKGLEDVR